MEIFRLWILGEQKQVHSWGLDTMQLPALINTLPDPAVV